MNFYSCVQIDSFSLLSLLSLTHFSFPISHCSVPNFSDFLLSSANFIVVCPDPSSSSCSHRRLPRSANFTQISQTELGNLLKRTKNYSSPLPSEQFKDVFSQMMNPRGHLRPNLGY